MQLGIRIVLKIYELLLLLVLVVVSAPIYWAVNYNVLIDGVKKNGVLASVVVSIALLAPLMVSQHQIIAMVLIVISLTMFYLQYYYRQHVSAFQPKL